MAIGKQGATLEVMGGGDPTDSATVTINVKTDIPACAKPLPPKGPWQVPTYSADPSNGIGHYLGDAGRKGEIPNGRSPNEKAPMGAVVEVVGGRRKRGHRKRPRRKVSGERSRRKSESRKDEDMGDGASEFSQGGNGAVGNGTFAHYSRI